MALNIKSNNQIKLLASVVSIAVVLGACSSKPSPWSQQGSPWAGNKVESTEETVATAEEAQPVVAEEPVVVEEPAPWVMEPEATAAAATVDDMAQPEPMMEEVAGPAMAGGIMAQPAGYFVVQVCASSSMDKLMSFARSNNLSDQWTAQTNVDGKIWHVLLLGVYPTRAEADAALSIVRDKNLNTQPWIRTVGSVQAVAQ